jgi:acid phosphatase
MPGEMSFRRVLAAVLLASLAVVVLPPRILPARAAAVPALDHVFVIVMENSSYNQIIGSVDAPFINSLVPTGGLAANYRAITHPSLPNYLALVGGDTFGVVNDCTDCFISAPNIADNLEAAGKSWKAYMEAMPSPCFVGDSYPYVQKHDPFVYFDSVRTDTVRCESHVVPYSQLASDLLSATTTPNYAFITPDICNDMHDCSIATGDAWLGVAVPQILASPAFTTQNSLLVVVWDEDDSSGANQVPLLLIGGGVTPNFQSSVAYDHYSLLRTLENGLGLPALTANDAGATPMDDFFGTVPVAPINSGRAPLPKTQAVRGR